MAIEIVDFPIKHGGSFHSYVTNYQRVCHQQIFSKHRGLWIGTRFVISSELGGPKFEAQLWSGWESWNNAIAEICWNPCRICCFTTLRLFFGMPRKVSEIAVDGRTSTISLAVSSGKHTASYGKSPFLGVNPQRSEWTMPWGHGWPYSQTVSNYQRLNWFINPIGYIYIHT
jgi:hypothetical protein